MADISPEVSKYFSKLNKNRKNVPFKDPTKAREAQRKSVEARKRNKARKAHEQATS